MLTGENNIKAAISTGTLSRHCEASTTGWSGKATKLQDCVTKEEEMDVVDQLEPMQCVWRWMPVICLENVESNADVCNGALRWVVDVVGEPGNCSDCAIVVVSASNVESAKERAQVAANLVALKQVVA